MGQESELLACALASPDRVAVHDRAGWLALFAEDAVVEDPVGAAPNRRGQGGRGGRDELECFYDTFIAPNAIRFEPHLDVVAGCEVARDVTIHTRMASGFELAVPALLLYRLRVGVGGEVSIVRLAAHWQLPVLSLKTMMGGWRGLKTMISLTARMLSNQGVGGSLGYMQGMIRGMSGRRRARVRGFLEATLGGDVVALGEQFGGGEIRIEHPVDRVVEAARWLGEVEGLELDRVTPAGWTVACRFALRRAGEQERGLVFFELDPGSRRLARVRFFVTR